MRLYTIGFTQRSAASFFEALAAAGVSRLMDVRLNNVSQLAAFAKRDDLAYFLEAILGARYEHALPLAPTAELLDAYRKRRIGWAEYERGFCDLLAERQVEQLLDRAAFSLPTVLLCSEPTAARCHRRLVAEYLQQAWDNVEIVHL